jgi:putative peptidoglycan lipid II flippase
VNFGLLMLAMRSIAKGMRGRELTVNMAKLLTACVALSAVCWVGKVTLLRDFGHQSLLLQIVTLAVTIAVAAAVYFGMNVLLRNEEVSDFSAILKRKFGRK